MKQPDYAAIWKARRNSKAKTVRNMMACNALLKKGFIPLKQWRTEVATKVGMSEKTFTNAYYLQRFHRPPMIRINSRMVLVARGTAPVRIDVVTRLARAKYWKRGINLKAIEVRELLRIVNKKSKP